MKLNDESRESFEGSRGPLPTLFNPRFCPTIGVHLTTPFARRSSGVLEPATYLRAS